MVKNKINKTSFVLSIILLLIIILLLMAKFEKPSFREDSIDNPETKNENPDTRPVLLEADSDIGVILVHGLGATTWETKKLAQYLNERNITTHQVLLAGHGEDIYELEQTTSSQWYQSVEKALDAMQKPDKFIIGSSIGSLLAIELSEKKELNGIVLFSIPLTFNDRRIKYTPFLKYFKRFSHREIESEHQPFYHENFPLKTLAEMINYIKKVKTLIPQVKTHVLIIQSKNDLRLGYENAQFIYDNIASEKKEIMWFNTDKHVLIIEYADETQDFKNERQEAFEKVHKFITDNSK